MTHSYRTYALPLSLFMFSPFIRLRVALCVSHTLSPSLHHLLLI